MRNIILITVLLVSFSLIGCRTHATYTSTNVTSSDYFETEKEQEDSEANIQDLVERGYLLELLSWNWESEFEYVTAQGEVRNISSKKLENVQVLVTWFDGQNRMITSNSSLIDYNPIMPGQVSHFKVIEFDDPLMESATIEFKNMSGNVIKTHTASD